MPLLRIWWGSPILSVGLQPDCTHSTISSADLQLPHRNGSEQLVHGGILVGKINRALRQGGVRDLGELGSSGSV